MIERTADPFNSGNENVSSDVKVVDLRAHGPVEHKPPIDFAADGPEIKVVVEETKR
jgi:hypothetical protein